MKNLILLVFLGLGTYLASAQDVNDDQISTIFSRSHHNGGYGALSFGHTEIDGKDAFLMGARGSWVIDHSFAVGLGGCGFVNNVNYHNWLDNAINNDLAGGYGGIYLEPILAPKLPVHLSLPVLFGVGGITRINDNNPDYWDSDQQDVYFVFEPAVELEFNMTRHFRLAGTLGYRFTSKIEMAGVDPDMLEGLNAGVIFKFGRF